MSAAAIPEADQATCPICDRLVRAKRMRKLYDVPVCHKCSNGFANRRQLGWIIDHVASIALSALVGFLVVMMFPQAFPPGRTTTPVEDVFWIAFSWVLVPMLFAFKDGFGGYSPGKWLCGVRAVDRDTREPISFLQSFKRNLVLIIPVVPLLVALQLIKGPRSGDKWANTCVIWEKKAFRMPFDPRGVLCTKCGYNLTGNVSGRCPECGQLIPIKAPAARVASLAAASGLSVTPDLSTPQR
jgi:uncharacterized RDD family membrane protein YckC/predicted RNA-binding Zn-ribbon protein involved in translation (DUF1610 family)